MGIGVGPLILKCTRSNGLEEIDSLSSNGKRVSFPRWQVI